ncbi:MAG: UDP-N-acetylglucosamine--N-acetylmuramyl-(pentapeptide) pyrophosphoryl-undecaprenol N-acetylglucosamine transferase [Planctomycetota bacterium]
MTGRVRLGVAFLGGGSGGHIHPALAVAGALEHIEPAARAVFLTGDRDADRDALDRVEVFGRPADRRPLRARPPALQPLRLARFVGGWGVSVRESRRALRELKDGCERVVALSTGGYVSPPAAQAARVERVPLVLVSLDAAIGRANRYVARRAERRLVAQADAPPGWQAVGPIVGAAAIAPADTRGCRELLGLDPDPPTLLVVGGSQGARTINDVLVRLCDEQPELLSGWQVVHLAGSADAANRLADAYERASVPALVRDRLAPIGPAWGAASLAISRAGAGGVAEARANAVPAIFLPYPHHADRHQARNAQPLIDASGALLQADHIDPAANLAALAPVLADLARDPARREAMAAALRAMPRADGAHACARALADAAR